LVTAVPCTLTGNVVDLCIARDRIVAGLMRGMGFDRWQPNTSKPTLNGKLFIDENDRSML
jgi:hypothetical protein